MALTIQTSGVVFILLSYLFSDVLCRSKNQHLKLLTISIFLYLEILFLSFFNILTYQSLLFITFLKLVYIVYKRDAITKFEFKNKFNFVNLLVLIIYLIYGYLASKTGFTIDDVLVSYLTRVNQWIQNQSVFLSLDIYPYYSTVLTYPIGSPLKLLIIKIFKLPDYFFLLISAFVTYQILLTIKKFFSLNDKEFIYAKFLLPLSPIILVLSINGLTDLIFSYFLLNSFYYISSFYKNNNEEYLLLSSVFAVFSGNIKYHGIFILFIVGLIVLSTKKIKNILNFSIYTLSNILMFLFPNILWQYNNDIFKFLSDNVNTQFNRSSGNIQSIEVFNKLGIFENLLLNFYNSFTHTFINYLFVDFPMLYFLRDNEYPYILFIKNFNVFLKFRQVPTLGPIIFTLCLISIYYLLNNFIKNKKFNKYVLDFSYFLIMLFIIFLFLENFFVALTIFLVSLIIFSSLKNKKYNLNLKDLDMNLNIVLIILISYFSLISLRDFNDSNLRYLFPLLLFIFPFGLKAISRSIKSNKFKIFIILITIISSIQPIFLNTLVSVNRYPDLKFYSNKYENITRNWGSCQKDLIQVVNKYYDYLNEKNQNFNTLISTNEKFPISIFDKNKTYFSNIDTSSSISPQFFEKNNSNILIISEEFFTYDKDVILLLGSNSYNIIRGGNFDYYIINLFSLDICRNGIQNFAPATTIPKVLVTIDGRKYFYLQREIDDGTVERDIQRTKNKNKWNCYMTDAQIERGDCKTYNNS